MPVALRRDGDGWLARRATSGGSGSHLAASLARCDGLACVPLEVPEVRPGDTLTVMRCEP